MKLSIDLDGVLCNFTDQIVEVANSLWPGRLPLGYEPRDYGYKDGLSKEEWDEVWRKIRANPMFYESGPAYEENAAALREFLNQHKGNEIYFVTSRKDTGGKSVAIQTENWLLEQGIYSDGYNYCAVIPVSSPDVKKFVMSDLDISFSVDDLGATVEECSVVKGHKAFLMDRTWNRDRNYGPRVDNLQQFFEIITGVRQEA